MGSAPDGVTPFGECGLKLDQAKKREQLQGCHSLRGVWVEIEKGVKKEMDEKSHSLRGVWVEIVSQDGKYRKTKVTPFGECGLK